MKKFLLLMVAVCLTFAMISCDDGNGGGGGGHTHDYVWEVGTAFTSLTVAQEVKGTCSHDATHTKTTTVTLAKYLALHTTNTADNPVSLPMQIDIGTMTEETSGWRQLLTAIDTAGKFVDLDLSACTMTGTEFNPDRNVETGKNKIVSIALPDTATSIADGAYISFQFNPTFMYFTVLKTFSGTGLSSIGNYAFCSCTSLTSVTMPDGVESIGTYAFFACLKLTSVTIPDSVTSIGDGAFSACSGLTSVTIPNGVTSIGNYMFQSCNGLTSVTIPDGVTSIGDRAFDSCIGLISVTIPDSVISIGDSAFQSCNSLTSVTIPNGVTSIGNGAFHICEGLTSITVAGGNTTYRDETNCLIRIADNALILGCKTSEIPDSVTSIGGSAFRGCIGLTSVTIPDSVTSIGDWAFSRCRELTGVTIPDSVISIGENAFDGCISLTSVTFAEGSNITEFSGYAFPQGTLTGDNLKNAYEEGGAGTYTRTAGGEVWTKQQ